MNTSAVQPVSRQVGARQPALNERFLKRGVFIAIVIACPSFVPSVVSAQVFDAFNGPLDGGGPGIPVCINQSWSYAPCWVQVGNPLVRMPPGNGENASLVIGQTVTLDTSSASLGTLTIAAQPGNTGTFFQPGSTLSATTEDIGPGGTYSQSGGANDVSGALTMTATYNLQGGALSAGSETVSQVNLGPLGVTAGTFNQSDGTNTVDGALSLSSIGGGYAKYNLSGGSLSVLGDETIGNLGQGMFTQSGDSTNTVTGTLGIGTNGASSTYDLQGGTLHADTTIEIGILGTLSVQGGSVSYATLMLSGGTLDASVPFVNSTILTGSGTITAGANFINTGMVTLTGATLVNGTILNDVGATFITDSPLVVNGDVRNSGTFTVNGGPLSVLMLTNLGVLTIIGSASGVINNFGVFVDNGALVVDPTTVRIQTLDIDATGYLSAARGDVFEVSGNFQNLSTRNLLWSTGAAELEFVGGGSHTFGLAGLSGAGFKNNFAWGTLAIAPGNTLDLGKGSGDALYVNFLQGLDVLGSTITNVDGATGLSVYYNAADNPFLRGDYNLMGGGELIPGTSTSVPEPATWLLMAGGLVWLVAQRARPRRKASATLR